MITGLDEGDIICPTCNGEPKGSDSSASQFCDTCMNTGKLTWTESIIGRKNLNIPGLVYAPYLSCTITTTLPTIQTKEQLKKYSKLICYNSTELKGKKYAKG